ncbi:FecR family protein [Catenovulum sp. SX2]|uniref:FecR family protein n=1 Tax=Catenovulum sp. SX2 TaxID=3398614 RepID=UPI003F86F0F1
MKWHHATKVINILAIVALALPVKAADIAGRTLVALGEVEAVGDDTRPLKRRSPVYNIDTVTTGPKSKAQFKMTDGGLLAIKENTQLIISTYEYDAETDTGSAVMNLLSGGIRTISGKIKNDNGEYQLKTPVGSIGIRGTHFEIELVDGEMFIAVWDGAIDVNVDVGGGVELVSFGANENFNFGKIQSNGQVTGLLTVPEVFDSGHSADPTQNDDETQQSGEDSEDNDDNASSNSGSGTTQNNSEQAQSNAATNNQGSSADLQVEVATNEDLETETTELNATDKIEIIVDTTEFDPEVIDPSEQELQDNLGINPILGRTGITSFDLTSHGFGPNVTDASMSMQIDFDTQTVEEGFLSFTDEGGEWLARFNGAIRDAELDIGVNYASYGDNLAEGTIDAKFIEADTISGSVELKEQEDESVTAGGIFTLGESASPTPVDEAATDL